MPPHRLDGYVVVFAIDCDENSNTNTQATFGMALGPEVLEEFGSPLNTLESVYIRGEAWGEDERVPFEMLFSEEGVENLVMKLGTDSDYTIQRFQNGSTAISQISTKTNGVWSECFLTSQFEDSSMRDLQDVLYVTMVDGARIVQDSDGTDVAIIHEVEVNPSSTKLDSMFPTDEECVNVPVSEDYVSYTYSNETNNFDNSTTSGGRRLGSYDWYDWCSSENFQPYTSSVLYSSVTEILTRTSRSNSGTGRTVCPTITVSIE